VSVCKVSSCNSRLWALCCSSGNLAFNTALMRLTHLRKREGVGPCGTFNAFLATPAGRRQRREGLEFIEDEARRLAPKQQGSISCRHDQMSCCRAQVAVGARQLLSVRDRSRRTCRATTDVHMAAQ
jgi:hypothetical protein